MRIRSVVAATFIAAAIAAVGAGTASAHGNNDHDGFVGAGYAQESGYAHFSNIGGPFGITEGHFGGSASEGGFIAAGH
ncbi:hypothetical protein ACIQU5_30220 [Streptomyces sp. NPDC090306]|uniref:hypothetical protein n=1 Tax=unclassified Streptomyces TaxID=2593676 RepID=UPI0036E06714